MGLITWNWKFFIGPVTVYENHGIKNGKPRTFRRTSGYETRRIYSGLRHPIAGDMVDIPCYGSCKVERVNYVGGKRSRSWIVTIVISPKSLGNENWWTENPNHPLVKNSRFWKLASVIVKEDYKDLDLPEDGYVEGDIDKI